MKLFIDESKERRRSSIEGTVANAGSECRNEGPMRRGETPAAAPACR